ncbi:unnamed protein product [Tilletia controversa]|uniref:Uncharacterized protein n=3 Tax=Tilletia TaxID=13289 RepID=A0A8X7MYE2_9BASI|nr:hypothetical protein CF336_g1626 [Tilletia laevis]KAE8201137.1 hypothetical protein CF328_g2768 [Tilletia controversa]KAE8263373.1 hypothetical protein A4X03_0g1734 [Tilletia caries]KAE8207839.1 hypothetical protein CF335_g849 [Tilletia laevis]KAE8253446.1 hypothetical protein A4X06_0g1448 [Tilletia controversa]
MASTSPLKRIDGSNAKRPNEAAPYSAPPEWSTPSTDIYGSMLGSASMMSGAAMLMKQPVIAYFGLIAALAHLAQHKPHSERTNKEGTASPMLSLAFSFMAIAALSIPKLMADFDWRQAWRAPGFDSVLAKVVP